MCMIKRTENDFFEKISVKNKKTIREYSYKIKAWKLFVDERFGDPNFIPKDKQDALDLFQLFINRLAKNHSAVTVLNYSSGVRKFLYYRGAPLTKDDVSEFIDMPRPIKKELHGLVLEEIHLILNSLKYDDKVMFMSQLSSGMRIGELVQLRKRHLILTHDRIIVKIPHTIAKFSKARTTILSIESSKLLQVILKRKNDDDLVFGSSENPESSVANKEKILRTHLNQIGLNQRYDGTRNYQINTHSFRAYFITKVSRHDPNLAKFFSGQEGYLLQYDRLTDDEKLEYYLDFEKDLLIFDLVKKEEEIKKLRIANTMISDQEQQIKDQGIRIKNLERLYLSSNIPSMNKH